MSAKDRDSPKVGQIPEGLDVELGSADDLDLTDEQFKAIFGYDRALERPDQHKGPQSHRPD